MHTSVAVVSAHDSTSTLIVVLGAVKAPNKETTRTQPTAAAIMPRLRLPAMKSFSAKGLDSFHTRVQGRMAKNRSRATVATAGRKNQFCWLEVDLQHQAQVFMRLGKVKD